MSVPTSAERFSSLTAMKAAHLSLTRQVPPGHAPSLADLENIETFVSKGRATGVLLDSHDQQRDAQCLLDHWAGYLTKHRREVDSTLDEYDPAQAPDLEDVACPYPGLEAFQTGDALHFFGRSHLIEELVRRLDSERFVAIVGPSGSGKSSLLLAGLVPVLTRLRHWERSLRIVPGADPLVGLAHAVGALPDDGHGWLERRVDQLRSSPDALPALLDATGKSTLLIVDQFEETFTICDDAATRQAFEASLVALIHGSRLPHRLLLAMRSDYEGHLTRMPLLWSEFVKAKVALLPLGPHDLRDAIEGPARQVGLKFEDGLVDALYSDVNGEAAALPLLQSVLRQLWQRKHRNLVTWDDYRRLGNARIALGKTADEFYNGLLPEDQNRVRRIFIRLVRPAAGQEVTSNRITRRNLATSFQDAGWLDATLQRLRAAGLIRVTTGDTPDDDQIEVAHEALVRNWPTLVDWLNQERSAMTLGRRLETRIAEWLRLGAGTAGLLDEESLAEVKRWRKDPDAALLAYGDKLDRFIAASQGAIDRARQEDDDARRREVELLESIATEKSLKARQLRKWTIYFAALSIMSVLIALDALGQRRYAEERSQVAFDQSAKATSFATAAKAAEKLATSNEALARANEVRANDEAAVARQQTQRVERLNGEVTRSNKQLAEQVRLLESRKLAARAQSLLPDADTSLLLGWTAARWIYPSNDEEIWLAAGAIRDGLREARTIAILNAPDGAAIVNSAFTPDGLNVVTASEDGSLIVWDVARGGEAKRNTRLPWTPAKIAISPDGSFIVVGGKEGVAVLETDSLRTRCELKNGPVQHLAVSPDSRMLAAVIDNKVLLSTTAACVPDPTPIKIGSTSDITFSANGYWIASRDKAGTLQVWDTAKRKEILAIETEFAPGEFYPLAFRPDGTQLAVAMERSISIYFTSPRSTSDSRPGLPTGTPFSLSAFSDDVTALAYNQRGDLLAAGSRDGTVTVWNAGDRRQLYTFGGDQGVTSIAFSPDGGRILTTSDDGVARIWSNGALLTLGLGSYRLAVSHDRSRLAVYGTDNVVHVVDPEKGNEVRISQPSRPTLLALDDVSGRIAVATERGEVMVYESSGQMARPLPRQPRILALALSPGGDSLAISAGGGLSIWSADGMREMPDGAGTQSLAFSPDGKKLIGTLDKSLASWDVASGQKKMVRTTERITSPMFSADGQLISAQAESTQIQVWTADLDPQIHTFVAGRAGSSTSNSSLALSADWQRVVAVNGTDGVTLWDYAGRALTNLVVAKAGPTEAAFLKDGRVAVLTKDGTLYALPVEPGDTMRAAMSSLVRAWDARECEAYMLVESDFCKKTAPALQQVAEGNRIARTGNIERARAVYASALKADPWLGRFVDPEKQATQQADMTAALPERLRANGLIARGEWLIGQALAAQAAEQSNDTIINRAAAYFAQAGDKSGDDPALRNLLTATGKAWAQVLTNTGRFLAGRVDDEANEIAVSYLTKARRLDPSLTFEPKREVGVLVTQKQIEPARKLRATDPSATLQAYLRVQAQFPELLNGTLWNELCWEGMLYARSIEDARVRAERVTRACDEAVKVDPNNARFADSRGLNRLLVGKGTEARPDLQAFIESNDVVTERKGLRRRWLADVNIRPNRNPVSEEDLSQLKAWANLKTD